MKSIIFAITLLWSVSAQAAMVRVIGIEDGRTIAVDRGGTRASVRLAGVKITEELRARELLRWTIGTAWVMLEPAGDEFLVYRSPDALFVNRELVLRGYARPTLPGIEPETAPAVVTYLGVINPEGPQRTTQSAREPNRGSGTHRRPRASPSPRTTSNPSAAPNPSTSAQTPTSGARTRARRSRGSSH